VQREVIELLELKRNVQAKQVGSGRAVGSVGIAQLGGQASASVQAGCKS